MRYTNVYLASLGVHLGAMVRTPAAIRRGLLTVQSARTTRQRSVCVAAEPATELAVKAGHHAVTNYLDQSRPHGGPIPLDVYLHATLESGPQSWAAPGEILAQLPVTRCGAATGLTANGVQVLCIAAAMLQAGAKHTTGLVTTSTRFGSSDWDRYTIDYDVLYGDAAAAVVLSRDTGFAEVLSSAAVTDCTLAGYTRGLEPRTAPGSDDANVPVDLLARKAAWLSANGGAEQFLRQIGVGVADVVNRALTEAEINLGDVRWILTPFLGAEAVEAQWLRSLGIDQSRTMTALGLHTGHLGPSDHLVALYHLIRTNQLAPGDHVLLGGCGPGMTWTAAVLRLATTPATTTSPVDEPID